MAIPMTARIEELAEELSRLTGESVAEAVEKALLERQKRVRKQAFALTPEQQKQFDDYLEFMQREIWSHIPDHLLGKSISKEEREEILGYGPDGV